MCFIFLFTWLTFTLRKKKKSGCQRSSEVIRWSFERSSWSIKKVLKRDRRRRDLARCDSQLFCDALLVWPVLLSECKKGRGLVCQQHDSQSRPRSGGPGASAGTAELFCFPLTRSSFGLCCGSSSCVFGGGMSLLNQVMWAGACVHLQWTNQPAPWWADFWPN